MVEGPYVKSVLTVIACSLSIIALGQLQGSATAAPQPIAATGLPGPPKAQGAEHPVRWRVAHATEETGHSDTYCGTAINVTNLTGSTVEAEVEWINAAGTSIAVRDEFVFANAKKTFVADSDVSPVPWSFQNSANLDDFAGYALVRAEDPRIMVGAIEYCRAGLADAPLVSQVAIPAYPAGATVRYFQAATPAPRPALTAGSPRTGVVR